LKEVKAAPVQVRSLPAVEAKAINLKALNEKNIIQIKYI
jgi:hypothetical protein